MTPYERGYTAGLKAAAEVCEKQMNNPNASKGEYWLGSSDSAFVCKEEILSLPIVGEADQRGAAAEQQRDGARNHPAVIPNAAPTTTPASRCSQSEP